jgi:hypothetical protein
MPGRYIPDGRMIVGKSKFMLEAATFVGHCVHTLRAMITETTLWMVHHGQIRVAALWKANCNNQGLLAGSAAELRHKGISQFFLPAVYLQPSTTAMHYNAAITSHFFESVCHSILLSLGTLFLGTLILAVLFYVFYWTSS